MRPVTSPERWSIADLAKRYDGLYKQAAQDSVSEVNQTIESLSRHFNRIEFDFSMPASRNVYQSKLHARITGYVFVTSLWCQWNSKQAGSAPHVVVDSPALFRLLNDWVGREWKADSGPRPCAHLSWKLWVRRRFIGLSSWLRVPLKMLRIWWFVRKVASSVGRLEEVERMPTILLDTYLTESSFLSGKYYDRYFGEYPNLIRRTGRRFVLLPNFLLVKNWRQFIDEYRTSAASSRPLLLCKESFIGLSLYGSIIVRLVRSAFLCCPQDVKFADLVEEELSYDGITDISFEAHLNYEFIRWFKRNEIEARLQIEALVEWNENHLYDRAIWKGLTDFNVGMLAACYQVVLLDPSHDFYIDPIMSEIERGLYPKRLMLPGDLWAEGRLFSRYGVQSFIVPLYRLRPLVDRLRTADANVKSMPNRILISLPLVEDYVAELIDLGIRLAERLPNYSVVIRPHPARPVRLPVEVPNLSIDTFSGATESVEVSGLLISVASSVCIEAVALGVPCCVYEAIGVAIQNPIPPSMRRRLSRTVRDVDDVIQALSAIQSTNGLEYMRRDRLLPQDFGFEVVLGGSAEERLFG